MNRKLLLVIAAALVAAAGTGWIAAQEKTKPGAKREAKASKAPATAATAAAPARPEDEQAIKAASQAFAKAFETGDDKAVAALLTEGAEYIDDEGAPVRGREALANAYADLFAKRKELKAEAKTDAIRFLGTDTAIEEGTFTVTAKDGPPNSSRFSTLYARQNGKWLIALLKEWQDETTNQPTLKDLEWLIGTWESASDEVTARTTYSWTASKAFIRCDYTITTKKDSEKPSSGTQVIGVDPAVGNIRAWLFASDGGIGESTWIWEGDRWMIESVGTLADGTSTSAVNFLARSGDDAFTWRSVQRINAGEAEPDLPAVTVKRVAAVGATPAAKGR